MDTVWVLTSRYSDGSDAGDVIRVYEDEADGLEALEVAQFAGADMVKRVELHATLIVRKR